MVKTVCHSLYGSRTGTNNVSRTCKTSDKNSVDLEILANGLQILRNVTEYCIESKTRCKGIRFE